MPYPSVEGQQYLSNLEELLDELWSHLSHDPAVAAEPNFKERIMTLAVCDPGDLNSPITIFAKMGLQLGAEPSIGDKAIEEADLNDIGEESFDQVPEETLGEVMQDGKEKVANWKGYAADAYRENFVNKYLSGGSVLKRQRLIANYLQIVATAEQALYADIRKDISEAVNRANSAAEVLADDLRTDPGDVALTLRMVATLAGATSSLAFPVTGALVAAAGTASANALEAQGAGEQSPAVDFANAASLKALYHEIVRLIDDIEDKYEDELARVARAIGTIITLMDNGESREQLIGPRIAGQALDDEETNHQQPLGYDSDGNAYVEEDYLEEFKSENE